MVKLWALESVRHSNIYGFLYTKANIADVIEQYFYVKGAKEVRVDPLIYALSATLRDGTFIIMYLGDWIVVQGEETTLVREKDFGTHYKHK